MIFNITSRIFDLYYWLKAQTRPLFIDCRTKCLVYLSLYVYIGTSSSVLKVLKSFRSNPGRHKQLFIENPVISSIALLYLAYMKAVRNTSFLT